MEEEPKYTQEDVDRALARVAAGEKTAVIARTSPVPLRSLFRLVQRVKEGDLAPRRPGSAAGDAKWLHLSLQTNILTQTFLWGYYNVEASETCVEFGILLVTLPANATHLFQHLYVAVFKPYKDCVHDLMLEWLCAINDPVLRKSNAIKIACTVYRRALVDKPASAVNGFRECGIWPLSLVALKARLNLYSSGGVKGNMGTAEWLQRREPVIEEVRNEILLLPPVAVTAKKRKRVTVDVSGRLVTKEQLTAGASE